MPYQITPEGEAAVATSETALTDYQRQALQYLFDNNYKDEFHELSVIARELDLHPHATTGLLHSLYRRGLVSKSM